MAKSLMKPCACADVDIRHNDDDTGIVITALLPGVDKKDIELSMGTHNICIAGEREDFKYDGCYQLIHDVDPDKSDAKFENGLLTVTVPFKEPLKGKRIEIH